MLAALRLPLTLVLGFLLVLFADAGILLATDALTDGILRVDGFGWALLAALVIAAVSVVLAVLLGSDDRSSIRIAQRIARRQGIIADDRRPGDHLPRDRRARAARAAAGDARRQRAGDGSLDGGRNAPAERVGDRSVLADGGEPGGDPAGIQRGHLGLPLGREGDRNDADLLGAAGLRGDRAAASTGIGLLVDGGSSRGNLLSGEAEDVILTVSRMEAEKKSNPGYRAFLANGDNVTRTLVLFVWEVILEWIAAARAIRRDVRPRGHRGGIYPLMRARCACSCAT